MTKERLVTNLSQFNAYSTTPPSQKLVIAQGTGVLTLDAHRIIDSPSLLFMEHMYDTLLAPIPDSKIAPRLAESWMASRDSTEFTLTLKKGVKFHVGEVLNAEAVKINFDRKLDPKAGTAIGFLVAMKDKDQISLCPDVC